MRIVVKSETTLMIDANQGLNEKKTKDFRRPRIN